MGHPPRRPYPHRRHAEIHRLSSGSMAATYIRSEDVKATEPSAAPSSSPLSIRRFMSWKVRNGGHIPVVSSKPVQSVTIHTVGGFGVRTCRVHWGGTSKIHLEQHRAPWCRQPRAIAKHQDKEAFTRRLMRFWRGEADVPSREVERYRFGGRHSCNCPLGDHNEMSAGAMAGSILMPRDLKEDRGL